MKFELIMAEIEKDSELDKRNLDEEALRIPKLHSKYYRMFVDEFKILKGVELEYNQLRLSKQEYYLGKAEDQVYKDRPLDHKVLKQDLDIYMGADKDLQEMYGKKCLQEEKIKMIENFIKSLTARGYNIKAAIDFQKFKAGG